MQENRSITPKILRKSEVISFFYIKPQRIILLRIYVDNCLISFFYIKPQRSTQIIKRRRNCLISFFYIKPQPGLVRGSFLQIVLYLSSTSNHNLLTVCPFFVKLSYIFLLHQTTTLSLDGQGVSNCLISFFYIKPQPSI